jgi:polyphosphate kinase 2
MKDKNKEILHELYVELVKLQKEIIASKLKLLIILEGRDAAGKDGTIKNITKHLSPRETRVVALSKPSEREMQEWYFQRYSIELPSSGEMVIFNRSWYNRAGVEKVMGFCTDKQYKLFFDTVGAFEKILVNEGLIIMKYYLDISKGEQEKRLEDRKNDPLKQWKISPIDNDAQKYWKEYSEARDKMLLKTNFSHSRWFIVNAEDKETAHIALISHLLGHLKYKGKNKSLLKHDYKLVYPATKENIEGKLY